MPTPATSVVSAAVIGGDLIIGLSDGSIINCGRVQGPVGLKGDPGPMGATGRDGEDGNTIHSVEGIPQSFLGKDGDFAIDVTKWEIYGPRANMQWGTPTPLRGGGDKNKRHVNKGGDTRNDSGSGEYRPPIISPDGDLTLPTQYPGAKPLKDGDFWVDGNGALHVYYRLGWNKVRIYSDMVLPAGDAPVGSTRDVDGSVTVPGNGGTGQAIAEAANGETFRNQYEYNNWLYYRVDRAPIVADDEPDQHPDFPVTGLKPGDFWINAGDQLFTWKAHQWVPLFAKGLLDVSDKAPDEPQEGQLWFNTQADELTLYVFTGAEWVPASPPVSLDGIQSQIDNALIIQDDLLGRVATGEGKQRTLENKVSALEGTVVDGVWKYGSRAWPQNRGEFDIAINDDTKTTAWQDGQKLRIYKTDVKGRNFTFSEVSVADFVRIGQLGSNAIYKILSEARPKDDYFEFLIEIVSYEGEALEAILEYNFEFLPAFDATAYATKEYVDSMDELNVKKAGSTMTGDLKFDGGDRTLQIMNGHRLRIGARDSSNSGRTYLDIQTSNSNGTEGTDAGYRLKIYHLATPTEPLHAANKKYVDEKVEEAVGGLDTGSVPVGSIMIWMNSTAPAGWFKLQGDDFDVGRYPLLHAYLQGTGDYTSGKLPNWAGHYPGEYGDHLRPSNPALGKKVGSMTAKPVMGSPRSSAHIPNGNTRTFAATGNTNAYSDGKAKVSIDENWDSTTRPKTVVVHYIIKHD